MLSLILVFYGLLLIVEGELNDTSTIQCPNVKTKLSELRKRRHVTFPDGSDVVLTLSLVKAFMTHAPAGWNIALEIDVLFPLPDEKFTLAHSRRKLHHRQKREFWDKLKTALNYHNLNGHSCILRSICDASVYLLPPGISLVHDLLRAIFTAPQHDDDFLKEMNTSYSELSDPDFCAKNQDCPFSLLHLLMALQIA